MLIKQDAILQKLSKQKNIPYELLRILFNDFWQQIMMHLQHPENNFYKGIKIRDNIKFTLNPKQICRAYCNYLRFRQDTLSNYNEELLIIHKTLVDENVYTEKQKKLIQDFERDYLRVPGEEGNHSNEEE